MMPEDTWTVRVLPLAEVDWVGRRAFNPPVGRVGFVMRHRDDGWSVYLTGPYHDGLYGVQFLALGSPAELYEVGADFNVYDGRTLAGRVRVVE